MSWLRPESALWDAIASTVVSGFTLASPSLDLGAGNGIFSFITSGGAFSVEYDWYRNVDPTGFWDGRDIYDTFSSTPRPDWIARRPKYPIDWALDAKPNLLRQAEGLGFYRRCVAADAGGRLPFEDDSFQAVFSNMLYWLPSAEAALRELHRILRTGGRAILCLQNDKFIQYCPSYRWRARGSEILRLLNRGRSECGRWTISYATLVSLSKAMGFRIASHTYYLSPLTLLAWDIGLRPLSPVLIRMVQRLSEDGRHAIKVEWMDTLRPFLTELYELDLNDKEQGGYHCVCLEKA